MSTLYDRLGVDPLATATEIRDAWRRVVRTVHPDLARDAEDAARREALTAAVNEAYSVLADPEMRAEYDASLPWRARGGLLARLGRRMRRAGGERRWRPSAPHPAMPDFDLRLPDPSPLIGLGLWCVDSRVGQWGLVLLAASLAGLWGGAISAWCVALAVALLLSRGGSPTPLTDAGSIIWPAAGALGALARALVGAIGGSIAGSLSERIEEARTSTDEMNRITEQEREALAKEGLSRPRYEDYPARRPTRPVRPRRPRRVDWGDRQR